jgi:CDP-4-dehydro-6-deoxyglucose reductase
MTQPSSSPPQRFTAKLEEKIVHNPLYTEFHFELLAPPRLKNTAGQYVMIDIPQLPDPSRTPPLKRAYSMSDRPDIDHGFEIVVATANPGIGVNYLNSLAFGAQITCTAPLGLFTLHPTPDIQNLTFVATGSGIAPIKAMLADLLQIRQDRRPLQLYWGMYHETDFFWLDIFADWQRLFPNFSFTPVVTYPSETWTLSRGLVTDCLTVDGLKPATEVYLCGNPQMVTDVATLLTQHFSLPPTLIHQERF